MSESDEEFRARYGITRGDSGSSSWVATVSLLLQAAAFLFYARAYQAGGGELGNCNAIFSHFIGTLIAIIAFILAVLARKDRESKSNESLAAIVVAWISLIYGFGSVFPVFIPM